MNKYVIYLKFLKIKIRFFTVEKRLALKFFIKTYKNVPRQSGFYNKFHPKFDLDFE